MHLGQTATFLASVFNRPESKMQMLARLLREDAGPWVPKGGRGRSAPHLDSRELASLIIAMMACPDSPAQALDRLPHFAALQAETDDGSKMSFLDAFSILLTRLATESWRDAMARYWSVLLSVDLSTATISETLTVDGEDLVKSHDFWPELKNDGHDRPYWSGLSAMVELRWLTLFRIAKVVLANESDPLDEICAALPGEV